MRRRCLSLAVIVSSSLFFVAACEVGSVVSNQIEGPDAGVREEADANNNAPPADSPDAAPPPAVQCDDPVTANASGKHNPGQPCLDCHDGGGEAPRFTIGGTLFDSLIGTNRVDGATIHLVDADGVDHTLISARNGNFWSSQNFAFPVMVRASSCPNTQLMGGSVDAASGNCNQGGCHDSDFRIHLP